MKTNAKTCERVRPMSTLGAIRQWHDGTYWFLNHQCKGWSSFGYCYPNLETIAERWAIIIGQPDADEHGSYWPYELTAE